MADLVVLSLEAWDGVWRRNQHLISGLLSSDPHLRVLFMEPPADPLHDLRQGRRISRGQRPKATAIDAWDATTAAPTPSTESAPSSASASAARSVPGRLFTARTMKLLPRRIDPYVDARLAAQTMRAAATLGMRHPVLWVNDPAGATLLRRTSWPALYDITDDWAVADRGDRIMARVADDDAFLVTHADVVVVCSPELLRRKSPLRGAGSPPLLVPNAVDLAAYRTLQARPTDLPAGRIALYAGTLHRDRLDVDLTAATAAALRGGGTLVLLGPNALEEADTRTLRKHGVVILGARPRGAVPAYLQHADVLLVPHVVTPFTESLDPIKLYEYQAVAAPVVATRVAGFRDWIAPRLTLADPAGFAPAVYELMHGGPVRRRQATASALASAPDWSVRVAAMRTALDQLIGTRR